MYAETLIEAGEAEKLHEVLQRMARDKDGGIEPLIMMQHMAGLLVELLLDFDCPEEALSRSMHFIACSLQLDLDDKGHIQACDLPPSYKLDKETEIGRSLVRFCFLEDEEAVLKAHDTMINVISFQLRAWDEKGLDAMRSLQFLEACAYSCYAFEKSAQELCDLVIDVYIAQKNWSVGDAIVGLSGMAGHVIAQGECCQSIFEQTCHVMTQEATRLGVPAGSDWHFGLAANDSKANAPRALIDDLNAGAARFLDDMGLCETEDKAAACAKAAGRMLAVACTSHLPELEANIAKPLAMAAMTESYRAVMDEKAVITF